MNNRKWGEYDLDVGWDFFNSELKYATLQVLCRWILSVKKNYRPVKYHNWRHAFNVAQTMFTVLKTGKMEQFLDDLDVMSIIMFAWIFWLLKGHCWRLQFCDSLQILGLMVACLCHDLDHRGTNNAFQQQSASPLAVLYSTSTMEHHHFDQCVMILSSEGNNIFQVSLIYLRPYHKQMKMQLKWSRSLSPTITATTWSVWLPFCNYSKAFPLLLSLLKLFSKQAHSESNSLWMKDRRNYVV